MSLQGPERKGHSHPDLPSQPESTKGTMGKHQIIPYNPKKAQDPLNRICQIFREERDLFFQKMLALEKTATKDMHQYGEGKIFVLLGHSTAGKTSIIHQLMEVNQEWIESGYDIDFPSQLADQVRTKAPKLYAIMARAMGHTDIGGAVMGCKPYWKLHISKEEKGEAQAALEELRKKIEDFSLDYETMNAKMEDTVIENAMRGKSVIFDPYDEKEFLAHMIAQNKYASIKIGLAYCPFSDLAERVKKRNINAISRDQMADYRPPLQPLGQFCDFYEPAKPGSTVIDTLHRELVEEVIENAFNQEIDDIKKGFTGSTDELPEYERDKDEIKQNIMNKLGFKPGINEVNITPSRNGRALQIDYLFRTNVMQPSASAAIIQEWK